MNFECRHTDARYSYRRERQEPLTASQGGTQALVERINRIAIAAQVNLLAVRLEGSPCKRSPCQNTFSTRLRLCSPSVKSIYGVDPIGVLSSAVIHRGSPGEAVGPWPRMVTADESQVAAASECYYTVFLPQVAFVGRFPRGSERIYTGGALVPATCISACFASSESTF